MQQILFKNNFIKFFLIKYRKKKCLKSCVFHAAAKEGEERIPAGEMIMIHPNIISINIYSKRQFSVHMIFWKYQKTNI
jgi:hypothetical protein